MSEHFPVAVVGGGQAGLAMSWQLRERGIRHVVFEKSRIAENWRSQRWDSFCLVTPNWQCLLPGFAYSGGDPHGFMRKDEIVAYLEAYARLVDPPLRERVTVTKVVQSSDSGFVLATSQGTVMADAVVMAISSYHVPAMPAYAAALPPAVVQVHSCAYRNPSQLPDGAILVVGTGQSGCQIAEDLHLAGRQVHLSTGSAPRAPRFYRGRDAVDWLADMGQYDVPVEKHPLKEGVRRNANHYLTGRDGGRDIDLRRFALEGMRLYGRLQDIAGSLVRFADDLRKNLDGADAIYTGIQGAIDKHIAQNGIEAPGGCHYEPVCIPETSPSQLDLEGAGITSVVWATGFRPDFRFVEAPVFGPDGRPVHERGITVTDGLCFVGLPWLHTWGSGRFSGIARDTAYIADHLFERAAESPLLRMPMAS